METSKPNELRELKQTELLLKEALKNPKRDESLDMERYGKLAKVNRDIVKLENEDERRPM